MVFKFGRGYRSTFSLLFGNETPNINLYPFNNVNRYRILGSQGIPDETGIIWAPYIPVMNSPQPIITMSHTVVDGNHITDVSTSDSSQFIRIINGLIEQNETDF